MINAEDEIQNLNILIKASDARFNLLEKLHQKECIYINVLGLVVRIFTSTLVHLQAQNNQQLAVTVSFQEAEIACTILQQLHKQHIFLRKILEDTLINWKKTPLLVPILNALLPMLKQYRDQLPPQIIKLIYSIDALRFEPQLAFNRKFLATSFAAKDPSSSSGGSQVSPLTSFREIYNSILDQMEMYERFVSMTSRETPIIHEERDLTSDLVTQIRGVIMDFYERILHIRKAAFLPTVRAGLRPSQRLLIPHRLQREGLLTFMLAKGTAKMLPQKQWIYLFDDMIVCIPIIERVGLLTTTTNVSPIGTIIPLVTTWIVGLPDAPGLWTHAFMLSTPEEQITCCARSAGERDIWMRSIIACVQFCVKRSAEHSPMRPLIKSIRAFNTGSPRQVVNDLFPLPPSAAEPPTSGEEAPTEAVPVDVYHNFTPRDLQVALFLLKAPGLSKVKIGEYLSAMAHRPVLAAYVSLFDFTHVSFTDSLRRLLTSFRLSGEAQAIDRVMDHFAFRYLECNPTSFSHRDTAYVLAFSLIMLNTDAHNPNIKNKMQLSQFISNNRGIDQGKDLPQRLLETLYFEIVNNEIRKPPTTDAEIEQITWLLERDFVPSHPDALSPPAAISAAHVLGVPSLKKPDLAAPPAAPATPPEAADTAPSTTAAALPDSSPLPPPNVAAPSETVPTVPPQVADAAPAEASLPGNAPDATSLLSPPEVPAATSRPSSIEPHDVSATSDDDAHSLNSSPSSSPPSSPRQPPASNSAHSVPRLDLFALPGLSSQKSDPLAGPSLSDILKNSQSQDLSELFIPPDSTSEPPSESTFPTPSQPTDLIVSQSMDPIASQSMDPIASQSMDTGVTALNHPPSTQSATFINGPESTTPIIPTEDAISPPKHYETGTSSSSPFPHRNYSSPSISLPAVDDGGLTNPALMSRAPSSPFVQRTRAMESASAHIWTEPATPRVPVALAPPPKAVVLDTPRTRQAATKLTLEVLLGQTQEERYAKFRHSDGSVYKGYWINCKAHGLGQKAFGKEPGASKPGDGHQQKGMVFMLYDGHWISGVMEGHGCLTHFDWGCSLTGTWSNWRGNGTIRYQDGRVFNGEWVISEPNHLNLSLFGSLQRFDGSSYVGFLHNHNLHGLGLHIREIPSSSVLANWSANEITGFGPLFSPSTGDLLLSGWRAGLVYGPGIWATRSGVCIHSIKFRGPWKGKISAKLSSIDNFAKTDLFFGANRFLPLWPALLDSFIKHYALGPFRAKHARSLMNVFSKILFAWIQPMFAEADLSRVLLSSVAGMIHSLIHYVLFFLNPKQLVASTPVQPATPSTASAPDSMRASVRKTPNNNATRVSSEPHTPGGLQSGCATGSVNPASLPSTVPSYPSPLAFQISLLPGLPALLMEGASQVTRVPSSPEVFAPAPLPLGVQESESLDHATLLTEIWQNNVLASLLFAWICRHHSPDIEAPVPVDQFFPSESPEPASYTRQDQAVNKLRALPTQPHPYAKLRCLAAVLDLMVLDFVEDCDALRQALLDVIQQAKVPNLRAELDLIRYFAIYDNRPVLTFLEVLGD